MAGLYSFGADKDVPVGLKSSWNLEILMSKQEKRKSQRTHENTYIIHMEKKNPAERPGQ